MGLSGIKEKTAKFFSGTLGSILIAVSVLACVAAALAPVLHEVLHSEVGETLKQRGISETYRFYFHEAITRLKDLERADRENQELRHRLDELEKQYDRAEVEALEKTLHAQTDLKTKIQKEQTGSEIGQSLMQLKYEPPTHLMPHQLYALAVGYIRKNENQQAAAILTRLVDLKEDRSYKRPEVYMLTGVAWFRLENWKLAEIFIQKAIDGSSDRMQVHRQAKVWRALLLQKIGREKEAQRVMVDLIAKSPHSSEAKWINSGPDREPSQESSHDTHPAH
jgi:tetratricopeptide (TPR) repeat protein